MRSDTADIKRILTDNIPLLDIRAPVEFQRGAADGAVNIPLLDDKQRELIGKEYAQKGQDAAIALGLESATDDIKQARLKGWSDFVNKHPEGYLYCFRGGMRSSITQQWMNESGIRYPKVIGGYKAIRSYLLHRFEALAMAGNILVLSAPTGSGKTDLICQLSQSVDIEGLAKHRGSAFGSLFVDQPSQADWENTVAAQWLRLVENSDKPVMFESESHLIGRIALPSFFQDALRAAPVVELITDTKDRITRIREDYINTAMTAFQTDYSEAESFVKLESFISHSLSRIQRRLGGERYKKLNALVPAAVDDLRVSSTPDTMNEIVRTLLHDYYDPLYAHKMIGRKQQVIFRGTSDEIVDWINTRG